MPTVLWISVTVDVKLLIRRSFDTLTIIGPAKTGPAGTASYGREQVSRGAYHGLLS